MTFKPVISRRQLLQWSGLSGASLLLGGCATSLFSEQVGQAFEPLNQNLQALLLSQKPVPEFPTSAIEPNKLLINTFDTTPQIDPLQFRLQIQGEVNHPMQLSLADLQTMPLTSMVIRHVCVEGWAAIVQWGGVRLQDLIHLAQPKSNVRYVYFKSADGYYESWDLASAVHPQTLMVYQKNGAPLSIENGAPLRLASPVKLGYKQSKWVTQITLLSQLMPMKGYWEDQGYEWFGGL
ncbi:oxidoreductase [Phormidesmis priestleyi ULC007]|uniref:Oxidoreductase n=1 Tax=Phormidesmis priestleyi ULC007 TaxID=1920490 RepID=A0A2T1D908_9CYAN|nr:molybdopterin-dependent oxidoreductase [Phormidesmis priestleyi]PSB16990.1 oxidoreductase [Phormidesmis priestleyi ULC007]PZO47901.1 MAG: oxidoreductase [Phormidesmis priestleyi]